MHWTLKKQFTFEAAHRLPFHDGKCARLHGHTFVGWVVLQAPELQRTGPKTAMVLDFGSVTEQLEPLLEQHLDHYYLNESTGLESPTSEELARWIFDRLEPALGSLLQAVVIEENCTCRAEYSR